MESKSKGFGSIDEYIASFPKATQTKLKQMRAAVRSAAPQAEEKIAYQIPTFYQEGNIVHFAAFKNHIGFYPAPRGLEKFKKELSKYEGTKGAVRFPMDKPLPLSLVRKITKYRLAENLKRAKEKSKKKKY